MKSVNLVVALLLELAMLAAFAVKGLALPLPDPGPLAGAVLLPMLAATLWGLFAAPRARFPLTKLGTLAVKAGLLGGGAVLLATAGQPLWAAIDGAAVAVHLTLAWVWGQTPGRPGQRELRASLNALLDDYGARNADEASAVQQFRAFAATSEPLQGKANPRRHITASTWIVNPTRSRVLLTHHAKLHKWVQLGGHTDPGEDWTAAALREAREESGLADLRLAQSGLFDLDVHKIPERPGQAAHHHYDLRFLVEADDTTALTISDESRDLAWVPLSDLAQYTQEESQLRMARKTLP